MSPDCLPEAPAAKAALFDRHTITQNAGRGRPRDNREILAVGTEVPTAISALFGAHAQA